jgi:oxygen-independent coproporphyrinogen III oxidase
MANSANPKPLWDPQLIQTYNIAGPRYTSYPTAPQLNNVFNQAQLIKSLQQRSARHAPLSLYFHIPFCDTVCYYCACNKIITANKNQAEPYLKRLYKEMALYTKLIQPQDAGDSAGKKPITGTVEQLHWGGGTPTFISDIQKRQLMTEIRNHFQLLDDDSGDYSIEVHPGRMDLATIPLLRELGFNRLSMGVQDFNPAVQRAVNRFNSIEQVAELISAARREQFHSISMDIIYGLPLQTIDSIKATLQQVIELSPDRLSLFNYAHMPHLFKTQRLKIHHNSLPSPEEKLQMLQWAIAALCKAGYVFIGMDHFAKPGDSLVLAQQQGLLQRNFQGYSTHGNCDLLAFGVSAISAIGNGLVQNHKAIADYNRAVDAGELPWSRGLLLNQDDLLRKQIIMQLICHFRLDIRAFEQQHGIEFSDYFATELIQLQQMVADGLIRVDPQEIRVLQPGRLLIRAICMVFDAYLGAGVNQQAKTSATTAIGYSQVI